MKARADAIEARKRQLAPLQAPVMAIIREGGGEIIRSYWLVNAFEAHITPDILERLIWRRTCRTDRDLCSRQTGRPG